MKCQNCGTENPTGMRFCQECGQSLSGLASAPAGVACSACGHNNRLGIRFCEECGNSLEGSSVRQKPRFLRPWLIVGILVVVIGLGAYYFLMPELSRKEAVNLTGERIESLYPGLGGSTPSVQTNRSEGETTYTIEYQTETGKIIFIVNAETGETMMLGTR